MIPIKALRLQTGELLAADVTYLAPVAANKVALIAALFVPDELLELADLTLATFNGSTPKAGVAGTQGVGVEPGTGDQIITNLAPAGGWIWEAAAAPAAPEIIYGAALTDNAGAVLLATELFDNPVTITDVGDQVSLGDIIFRLPNSIMS